VLVLTKKDDKFLMIREAKAGARGQWYLPAGHVGAGENLVDTGRRETQRSAGVEVNITGVLAIEHTNLQGLEGPYTRWRFILTAEAPDDAVLKSEPDEDSLAAGWFTPAEIFGLPLRSKDVLQVIFDSNGRTPLPIAGYTSRQA